jgi:two-component system nitrogen regulation response regulator NtrX
VVDDEPAIRDSLRMILEYEDYEFIGAASGPEGVAAVRREPPDLVVLDIKMPGMNGLETLAEIRKIDESLPVAMISGHGTITDAMQATRLGAFDFIEKPFTSERVLVTVSKGLEVRSAPPREPRAQAGNGVAVRARRTESDAPPRARVGATGGSHVGDRIAPR